MARIGWLYISVGPSKLDVALSVTSFLIVALLKFIPLRIEAKVLVDSCWVLQSIDYLLGESWSYNAACSSFCINLRPL